MKRILLCLLLTLPLSAQSTLPAYRIAVIGLVHSHVWGHLRTMVEGKTATLVGLAEPNQELVAEAKKSGVPENLIFSDYRQMLDKVKPDIVWAFVENNRHLEIARRRSAKDQPDLRKAARQHVSGCERDPGFGC